MRRWFRAFALCCFLAPQAALAEDPKPDVERWNDRSTPRRTVETLFFSICAYDFAPELIVNAIDCLDLGEIDPITRERDSALIAHELNGIITRRSDFPLYAVPETTTAARLALIDDGDFLIELIRQSDGRWKFSKETVARIPKMRSAAAQGERRTQEARMKLAEGRTDPEMTLRTFLHHAMNRRDFTEAARCLDLRDLPAKQRSSRGPELARKLTFVMQRCGFAFPQEFPSDPDGWRYIWHSNHRGRIMLDRVRLPDGRDAWLFSRLTLQNLDALVEGFHDVPPDPRYARLGKVIGVEVLTDVGGRVAPPRSVPPEFGSPRASLRTFLQALDDLEFDDSKARTILACMDLSEIDSADRASVGLRLAAKMQAILRPLNVDLLSVSDSWEAEPVRFHPSGETAPAMARQADGCWRFDQESVARIPEMFNNLSVEEKTALERRTPFHSARQTMRTMLTSVAQGNFALAAECLDLEAIPAGARAELGPALAHKLSYVVDRLGRVVIQEIPNEAEGPCYFVYRGSLGRISLSRGGEASRASDWLFTPDTVRQIDAMFQAMLERPEIGGSGIPALGGAEVSLFTMPGPWIRTRMPAGLRLSMLGLAVYQWIGLSLLLLGAAAPAWAGLKLTETLVAHLVGRARLDLSADFIGHKLRPLAFQVALWTLYFELPILDLPIGVVGVALPTVKFMWVGLLAWTVFRLVDLGTGIYSNSEHLKVRNNLSDMIVPTATRIVKLSILVVAFGYQVYLVGGGEWLTKLLAGLGLVGLAASLAAQDTLKNFFSTLLLIAEHPFQMGDLIVVDGLEGTVEGVGFRSTRVRTPEDSVVTIPNSVIAGTSVDNRGARKCRRFRGFVSMAYDTPVERMAAFRDALRAAAESRPELVRADKTDIHIHGLADSSVDLLVNVYFWVSTYRDELEARDWLTREILQTAERLGLEIAFPTRTIHVSGFASPVEADLPHEAVPAPKFAAKDWKAHPSPAK